MLDCVIERLIAVSSRMTGGSTGCMWMIVSMFEGRVGRNGLLFCTLCLVDMLYTPYRFGDYSSLDVQGS